MKKSLVVSIFCRMFASQFIPILGTCRQKCLISQNVLGAVTLIQNAAPFLNFEYQQVMKEIAGTIETVSTFTEGPTTAPLIRVTSTRLTEECGGTYSFPVYRVSRTFGDGKVSSVIQSSDYDPSELRGSYVVDRIPKGKTWGEVITTYHILTFQQVKDLFYKEEEKEIREGVIAAEAKKAQGISGAEKYGNAIKDRFESSDLDGDYRKYINEIKGWKPLERTKGFNIQDAFQPPPDGYIEHIQEQERQSIEDYVEYCKYAQKLQTELSEGSIFIQDELDYIALELAGIEEERIDLSAREGDLHRQIAYLKTLQSLTNKRKSDLNREYVEVAKERDTSESGDAGGVKMDNQQGDIRNDG